MDTNNTDPKIEAIQEDSATIAFNKGIKYSKWYIIFLCFSVFVLMIIDKINIASVKDLDRETRELITLLLDSVQTFTLWVFFTLVASYIFKGKGGSKLLEGIGNLIDKGTGFYKAKAQAKAGLVKKESKDVKPK